MAKQRDTIIEDGYLQSFTELSSTPTTNFPLMPLMAGLVKDGVLDPIFFALQLTPITMPIGWMGGFIASLLVSMGLFLWVMMKASLPAGGLMRRFIIRAVGALLLNLIPGPFTLIVPEYTILVLWYYYDERKAMKKYFERLENTKIESYT